MLLFGLGAPELIIILAVVLIIFGPKNLPKLGKSLGKTVKGIREGMDEAEGEIKGESKEAEDVVVKHTDDDDADVEDAPAEPAAEGEKFCGKCGVANPADNKFCKKCGAKLE